MEKGGGSHKARHTENTHMQKRERTEKGGEELILEESFTITRQKNKRHQREMSNNNNNKELSRTSREYGKHTDGKMKG